MDKNTANSVERPSKDPLEVRQRRDCGSVEVPKHRGTKAANRYSPLNNTFSSDDDEEESPLEFQQKLDSDSLASIFQELTTTEKRNENKTSDNAMSSISEVVAGAPILEVAKFVPEENNEVGGLKPIQKLQLNIIRHRTFIEESKIPKADIVATDQYHQITRKTSQLTMPVKLKPSTTRNIVRSNSLEQPASYHPYAA